MIDRVLNGRYRITERIGIGGMAEVYKAQDETLGRTVAVKVMLPQYASDPDFTARFRQEAASAANLQSPYIVNVYDWGQDNGTYFIVMEYVRGIDLKSAIQERGAIHQRKVAEIGSQVCQALSVAHGQDIVHRDIKPQNIMIQPDGNVKVMDFGIARAKNSVKDQTSSVLGTAHYISPEQAQGKDLSGTSDIYSLGCVLYEAATGVLPFDGPDAVSVAMKQVNDEPAPPSQENPGINPDLEAIILKAMAKSPYRRFTTAHDMKTALDEFLLGRPVMLAGAAAPSAASAATTVMGSVPPMSATDVAGMPGGTAVIPAIDSENGSPHGATAYRANETAKKKRGPIVAAAVAVIAVLIIAGIAVSSLFGGNAVVPDLTNSSQDEAKAALEKAGLKLGDVSEDYSSDVVSGHVMKQDPKADSKVKEGTKVNIVLSKGAEEGKVPKLDGMTAKEAEKAITDAGFVASFGGNESSDADKDTVSSQSPDAGTKAEKGTTVTYKISSGPETVTVPDVTGYSRDNATSRLEDAGFTVSALDGDHSTKYADGTVMRQDPSSGKLEKGSTVTIYISLGAESYDIPNVMGLSKSEAIGRLREKGFTNVGTTEAYSSEYASGTVMGMSDSGSTDSQDTYIELTISKGPQPSQNGNGDNGHGSHGNGGNGSDSSGGGGTGSNGTGQAA